MIYTIRRERSMAKKKTPDISAPSAAPRRRAPAKTTATDQRELAGVDAPAAAAAADASAAMPASAIALDPSYDEIAEAAYRRYLSRGGSHGRDFDDWIEAERELRSR